MPHTPFMFSESRLAAAPASDGRRYVRTVVAAVAAAAWAATQVSGWLLAASVVLGWTLLALAAIDLRRFILPDVMTLPLLLAGVAVGAAVDPAHLAAHAGGAVAGFVSLWLVARAYRVLRGRDGLGLGDAKLLAAGGAWVGLGGLPGIVLIACATALVSVLVRALARRRVAADMRIAFGPFLAFGIWIVWLYGPLQFGALL